MKKSIWKLFIVTAVAILLISLSLVTTACATDPWVGTYYGGKVNVQGNIYSSIVEITRSDVTISENGKDLTVSYTVTGDKITLDTGAVMYIAEEYNVLYLNESIANNFPARNGTVSISNWNTSIGNILPNTIARIMQLNSDGSLKIVEIQGDRYGTTLTTFGNYTLNSGVLIFNYDYGWLSNSGASQKVTFEGQRYFYIDESMNVYDGVLLRDYTKFLTPSNPSKPSDDKPNTPSTPTYTIQYIAGEGGYIEGETTQMVTIHYSWYVDETTGLYIFSISGNKGSEVTAIAHEGYVFDSWSDGVTTATRQDTNITQDITVTAHFRKVQ